MDKIVLNRNDSPANHPCSIVVCSKSALRAIYCIIHLPIGDGMWPKMWNDYQAPINGEVRWDTSAKEDVVLSQQQHLPTQHMYAEPNSALSVIILLANKEEIFHTYEYIYSRISENHPRQEEKQEEKQEEVKGVWSSSHLRTPSRPYWVCPHYLEQHVVLLTWLPRMKLTTCFMNRLSQRILPAQDGR